MSPDASNDWAAVNYWAHEDDFVSLPYDITKTTQASRPIIEFNSNLELNSTIANGQPSSVADSDFIYTQRKRSFSQYPLFNLYRCGSSIQCIKLHLPSP